MIDKSGDEETEDKINTKSAVGNNTVSPRFRRQADFPGTPEQNQDNTK